MTPKARGRRSAPIGLALLAALLLLLSPAGAAAQAPASDPASCLPAMAEFARRYPADWEQRVHPLIRPMIAWQRVVGRHGLVVGSGDGGTYWNVDVAYWDGVDLYALGLPRTHNGKPLYVRTAPDIPRAAVGGGPPPRLPLPRDGCAGAVDARIQVVWPHDGRGREAPVEAAPLVNVEVYIHELRPRQRPGAEGDWP